MMPDLTSLKIRTSINKRKQKKSIIFYDTDRPFITHNINLFNTKLRKVYPKTVFWHTQKIKS
jgi:hypothetical protein